MPHDKPFVSVSSLRMQSLCSRSLAFTFGLGLRRKIREKYFAVGTAYHEGLAQWYGGDAPNALDIALSKVEGEMPTDSYIQDIAEAKAEVKRLVEGYLQWAPTADDEASLTVLATEQKFCIDVGPCYLVGVIDVVGTDEYGFFIMDHKTTGSFGPSWSRNIDWDPQVIAYSYAARALGFQPENFIFNMAVKTKQARYDRVVVPINWTHIDWAMGNTIRALKREFHSLARTLPGILRRPGLAFDCRRCTYRSICEMHSHSPQHTARLVAEDYNVRDYTFFKEEVVEEKE